MGAFAGLALLLLILALGLGVAPAFFLLYLCLAIYGWSRWYTPWALRQITASRDVPDHVFCDEEAVVAINVRNRSPVPLSWLEISEGVSYELRRDRSVNEVISLPGRGASAVRYTIKPTKRGLYRLGPLFVSGGDLFGFFREQRPIDTPNAITVFPRIHSLGSLNLPSRTPFGRIASRRLLFRDPTSVTSLRSYQPGDPVRDIDWKVSAHRQELLVRRHRSMVSLPAMILIDLHRGDYQSWFWRFSVEWAIELGASLAAHLTQQRQAVGLATNGLYPGDDADGKEWLHDKELSRPETDRNDGDMRLPIPPRQGLDHLLAILGQLARVQAGDTVPFDRWARSACMGLDRGTTVFALVPSPSRDTVAVLRGIRKAGLDPVLIVPESDNRFGEIKALARQFGFAAYQISEPDHLDRWRLSAPQRISA